MGMDKKNTVKRKLFRLMPARKVAQEGYRGFKAGKRVIVPGLFNRLALITSVLVPRPLLCRILRVLNSP